MPRIQTLIVSRPGPAGANGPSDHTLLTNIGTNSHAAIDTHVASTANPHSTTKAQVGLGNADNTSDAAKPISTATQTALNAKAPLEIFPATQRYRDHFNTGISIASGSVGELRWGTGGGATSAGNAVAGRPGLVTRGTGATSGTLAHMYTGSGGLFHISDTFDGRFTLALNQTTADFIVRVGFMDQPTTSPPPDGIYFESLAADTTWFAVSRAAGVETRVNTTVALSTSYITLRIRRVNATTIGFTAGAGAEVTITTNLPPGRLHPAVHITNSVAADKTLTIDWFDVLLTGMVV